MKLPVITGRDAIPVRLIPFLTKWRLSPDVLASLLAGQHPHLHKRWTLQVRHGEGSGRVRRTVWMDHHCNMQELQESMRRHEASHLDWCRASVELLPAGAFVWRDEFEAEFSRLFGGLPVFVPRAGATELTDEQADDDLAAMVEDELSKKFGPDDEYADVSPDLPRWIEEDEEAGIDFDLLLSPDEMATVFEGFEQFTPCAPAVALPEPVAPATMPNASPATTHGPVAPPVEAPQVASWTFIPSKRETGYGADLNALLQRRHKSGKPIPTAAEVIDIWKANPPRIFHVVGGNLEYCPESGLRWKGVKEKSLNEAIKKRTSA